MITIVETVNNLTLSDDRKEITITSPGPQGPAGGGGSGSGDVVGPSSSTADDLVAFNGTTGKLIKDSGLTTSSLSSLLSNNSGTNTGDQDLSGLVPTTRTVNGHALSGDVTVTKSDVGLGSVVNADTTTTANITDSTDKRFVTDAELVVIGNTSGTNTGDQDLSGLVTKTTTVNGHALSDNVTVTKSDIALGSVPNTDCTTTANITDSTDKRFVTDAELTVIGNTSGINTGDQDLSGLVPNTRTVNGHALNGNVTVTSSDLGLSTHVLSVSIDGSGSAIATGDKSHRMYIPYDCTISAWHIEGDNDIVFDLKRSGSSIIGGGNKPTLSSSTSYGELVSSWTSNAITAGDVLTLNVASATATVADLTLMVNR